MRWKYAGDELPQIGEKVLSCQDGDYMMGYLGEDGFLWTEPDPSGYCINETKNWFWLSLPIFPEEDK